MKHEHHNINRSERSQDRENIHYSYSMDAHHMPQSDQHDMSHHHVNHNHGDHHTGHNHGHKELSAYYRFMFNFSFHFGTVREAQRILICALNK